MEAIHRSELSLDDEARANLDSCLGCLACESACPSGVSFGERMEAFRPLVKPTGIAALWHRWVARVAASPFLLCGGLLTAAVLDGFGARRLRRRIPGIGILPGRGARWWRPRRPAHTRAMPAPSERPETRVALLYGCVADSLRPSITVAAEYVLRRNGAMVVEMAEQRCCGALSLHAGRHAEARRMARETTFAFARSGVDRVVTTAAGCGAMMKDYGRLLADDADVADLAAGVAGMTVDIHEWLVERGIDPPRRQLSVNGLAYHDACHLLHAQKVAAAPRLVVEAATGSVPQDLGENAICCGSAGSYNLDNPRDGVLLGQRKAEAAKEGHVRIVAVGNVGCMLQLERAGDLSGHRIRAIHPVELLAEAYRREAGGLRVR